MMQQANEEAVYPPPPYSAVNPDAVNSDQQYADEQFKSEYNSGFSEASIRRAFVRKVYGILVCQLAVTSLFITVFMFFEPLKEYSRNNPWLWGLSFLATFICLIVLACCPHVRRAFPANIIVLAIFTLCESFLLGAAASCYDSEAVLIAVIITAVVVLSLTLFAMQTKWDFTMCSGGLLVLLIILICMGIFCIIFRNSVLHIVYASLGALVFSMYLVFDTQLMLGGKHKYSLSPEEYIFAALNLYLDIVNLFMFILQIVGRARSS